MYKKEVQYTQLNTQRIIQKENTLFFEKKTIKWNHIFKVFDKQKTDLF